MSDSVSGTGRISRKWKAKPIEAKGRFVRSGAGGKEEEVEGKEEACEPTPSEGTVSSSGVDVESTVGILDSSGRLGCVSNGD